MNPVSTFTEQAAQQPVADLNRTPGIIGWWTGDTDPTGIEQLPALLDQPGKPVYILNRNGRCLVSNEGNIRLGRGPEAGEALPVLAWLPPVQAERLGDPSFCRDYGIRFPYMTGAMANGIASTRLVTAIAGAGMLGSFGAAGLSVARVQDAVDELQNTLAGRSYCINLIHSPNEKDKEDKLVDLFIDKGVSLVEASAYMALTPAVVRYRIHGIHRDEGGRPRRYR